MRNYSQKTDGGQMLYKQIWEAIVWSYVIEYADFDVKKACNFELTAEGYHQGGLGDSVTEGNNLFYYNFEQKFVPNDYTLEFGNNTITKRRTARQWTIPVSANHYWNSYSYNNVVATKSSNNKILTITNTKVLTTDWNIRANAIEVGAVTTYKISGLTDDQTVVFKREQGNLTITADGTYDVNWGTSNVLRKIYFGKLQTTCNIVIEIVNAPAYNIIENQTSWNVPHWRGFNVFWYGDIWISVDNILSQYDNTKQKRIWYYTDDVSKFDNDITNKEHQIEGASDKSSDWLREVRINNKGDIVPSKTINGEYYKNFYYFNDGDISIHTTNVGGSVYVTHPYEGLLCFDSTNSILYPCGRNYGFVKVTILDD